MGEQKFRASLSKGRKSWCVIFRHPALPDSNGKPGKRMRKGLGTGDKEIAQGLVDQWNALLGNESFWKPSAREEAGRIFDRKVVEDFYKGIEAKIEDPWKVRDEGIPLPGIDEGYAKTMLVGGTGGGKTTLLRQIIGTDFKKERFPSISTAKTTIFDTEIILSPGLYQCVVSFLPRDQVRLYIEECVMSAVNAAVEGDSDDIVLRRLLEHSEQRFRLSYLLGNEMSEHHPEENDEIEDDLEDSDFELEEEMVYVTEDYKKEMRETLSHVFNRTKDIAREVRVQVSHSLNLEPHAFKHEEHEDYLEKIEESLYENIHFHDLVEDIIDGLGKKFDFLDGGKYDEDGSEDWPKRWYIETPDRAIFIKTVNRLSSNYAPNFGKLLAPLVQGLRIRGPFRPSWIDTGGEIPKIAIFDGEGLGHVPDSAFSLPTSVTRRFELADVIVLVDNATQPMQAASQLVLTSVVASGNDSKLTVVFTHFDQVTGDNLPSVSARKNHVFASLESAIKSVEKNIDPLAGRRLKRRLEGRVFFMSNINAKIAIGTRSKVRELRHLLELIKDIAVPPIIESAVPVYDLSRMFMCVLPASEEFHEIWNSRLGFSYKQGYVPEHWAKIKALSRRFAQSTTEDYYDNLRPIADFITLITNRLASFILNPKKWKPSNPPEIVQEAALSKISQEVYSRLHVVSPTRFKVEHLNEWHSAYAYRGTGSTRLRARDIRGIYEAAAPVPVETPPVYESHLLNLLEQIFVEAAKAAGAEVIGE